MSLLPLLYSNWWEDLDHPHTVLDQHFGHGIHPDHLPMLSQRRHFAQPMSNLLLPKYSAPIMYSRPWVDSLRQGPGGGASVVKADKDQFHVSLDVQQFAPEEINVRVVDRTVIVEGKHEEKQDEHGWISRQFSRRYIVPEQCDIDQVVSKLSSDGVLSIVVPRKQEPRDTKEKSIKIVHTGKPAIRENGQANGEQQQSAKEKEKK